MRKIKRLRAGGFGYIALDAADPVYRRGTSNENGGPERQQPAPAQVVARLARCEHHRAAG